VTHEDQLKTTLLTKWGTYSYRKMSLGLINVGETFQQAMYINFRGMIGECVLVYLDDVNIL
jgi:hypothetical protein